MTLLLRILIAAGSAFGVAVTIAIALALVDMYLVGHGRPSWVHQAIGGALAGKSWGDVVMLGSALIAGVSAWLLSGKPG